MELKSKSEEFACKYCDKIFSRSSSLSVHLCEPKRRAQQEHDPAVKLGYQAFLRFYEVNQGSAKLKTYADFAQSSYYKAFVKFGHHIRSINAIAPAKFIDYVIKKNIKLDHWCRDQHYAQYLRDHLRIEATQDALARSIETAKRWAEDSNSEFNHIFLYGNPNRIVYWITQGRISAWVVLNCASGVEFLEKLNNEQMTMVYPWIDPDYWQKRFRDYLADTEWCKEILNKAGF